MMDEHNQVIEAALRSAGGTPPSRLSVSLVGRSKKEVEEDGVQLILKQLFKSALEEVLELQPQKTEFVPNSTQFLSRNYKKLQNTYVVLVSYEFMYCIRRDAGMNSHINPIEPQVIDFDGERLVLPFMGLPLVAMHRIPTNRVVALKRGWFEYANVNSTRPGYAPQEIMASELASRDGEVGGVTNSTLIKIIKDKITILEYEDNDDAF